MSRLVVQLARDRSSVGQVFLEFGDGSIACGPFPIGAQSSTTLAVARRNPRRDPLLPYGDTPTGHFAIRAVVRTGRGTPFPKAEFGSSGALILEGLSGAAALADANGRFRFAIQGGDPGPDGCLRSTAGALRMRNSDLDVLIRSVEATQCKSCAVVDGEADASGAEPVLDDPSCSLVDPYPLPVPNTGRAITGAGIHLPRRGTVLMAMGATFVAQGAAHAALPYTAVTAPAKAPAPRNVSWLEMATAAADPAQAYNPPPTEETQQQAPPSGVKCQNNCEHETANQQLQGLGSGQTNPATFDGGLGSTLNQNAPSGQVSVPAVSTGTPVQAGTTQIPAQSQAQTPAAQQQQPAPQQQTAPQQPTATPQPATPAATTAPTAQQIIDQENAAEKARQKAKAHKYQIDRTGIPSPPPSSSPPPPSNERGE